MSIVDQAKSELARINFGEEDSAKMIQILELFFGQWDSGGAVHAVAPILQRLIAGKCLSPLTGDDDEWCDHGHCKQNKRISSVFKDDVRWPGVAYDIDRPFAPGSKTPLGPHGCPWPPVIFPYYPERAEVASPVVEIETVRPS